MALFSKNKKQKDKNKEKVKDIETGEIVQEEHEENTLPGSTVPIASQSRILDNVGTFSGIGGSETHKVLRGFYVSEKSSLGNSDGQYTFRVFENANKSEVKKEVSKLFNVKVKSVKTLNMPEKRRDFGKHPGVKSGFKKVIVILKEGYIIGQAKP
ncbi:MAG: 50S ribosomal protein L23 [Candidatus Taylorbacteria bacterium]|nr:50S ribosomal protein L23 [Candidatus Taylorbacteria bacterium]